MTSSHPAMPQGHQRSSAPQAISAHADAGDAQRRRGFGPRLRRLHARIGKAHHQAEGMVFSRALLAGAISPQQLAALIRALAPAYRWLETEAPPIAAALGASHLPWGSLNRSTALAHDLALLSGLAEAAPAAAGAAWLGQMQQLASSAPHRLMAHVYVRYGGDLSGGQQLGEQANRILHAAGLPSLSFWVFNAPTEALKAALHDGIEQLQLSAVQEEELLEEAEAAFHATQRLLAELA